MDQKALIAFNNTSASVTFKVQWGTKAFTYALPTHGAATFTWTGTQTGTPTIPAKSQIQGSSFSSENGLETETTADTTGGYDLGYISPNSQAVYNNVRSERRWRPSTCGPRAREAAGQQPSTSTTRRERR